MGLNWRLRCKLWVLIIRDNYNKQRTKDMALRQKPIKNKNYFSLRRFVHAINGVRLFIKTERNPLIYLIVMAIEAACGFYYHLGSQQWVALIIAITLVWTAEALNTALELVADEISEEYNERLGMAKDVAAGAVLLAALGALAVGIIIFVPCF